MSFYRATERTARKRHLCLACHTHVEPGERYLNCAGNSDGDIWFGAYHPDCHAIEIDLNDLTGRRHDEWSSLDEIVANDGFEVLDDAPASIRLRFGLPAEVERLDRAALRALAGKGDGT